ncbi:S-methyl-5-thioribose-1-phosphate isomerase [archaeon]|nr:MAG: S-methyl-5-thioribose-1-phosphate isomerase [archaeon]RLG64644.1 MAG: S-methyl-5-thioribose-1-phosphate isomerase [archaeon]RLG65166.1 MAG: S-methyl-5-thioribose-1-phosphate isomerase [archaeon]
MRVRIDGKIVELKTVWMEGTIVKMIDQRFLPYELKIFEARTVDETAWAIKEMVTRGAGAIGVAAAYGVAQAALQVKANSFVEFINLVEKEAEKIKRTRPTAVNLFYGVNRVLEAIKKASSIEEARRYAVEEAKKVAEEDENASRTIGKLGNELIPENARILTHCNAGALAFVDYGTALAPIREAFYSGKKIFVYVDETRPKLQGAKLTAWELEVEGIPYKVISDNAAGLLMYRKMIDLVIVGADRIARNGDVANKIGTYKLAVLAKENNIPFYVAAPTSTIDMNCPNGDHIPIEERREDEVHFVYGLSRSGEIIKVKITPMKAEAWNPAFDITPARYVTAIITEKGIVYPPFEKNIPKLFE